MAHPELSLAGDAVVWELFRGTSSWSKLVLDRRQREICEWTILIRACLE